jgi:hypothetical protein
MNGAASAVAAGLGRLFETLELKEQFRIFTHRPFLKSWLQIKHVRILRSFVTVAFCYFL